MDYDSNHKDENRIKIEYEDKKEPIEKNGNIIIKQDVNQQQLFPSIAEYFQFKVKGLAEFVYFS